MAEIGVHARALPGLPQDHSDIPVWNAENWYFEDFEIGDKIRSIRRTISEGEAMLFNSLVLDMHPYVGDQGFAEKEGIFGKRLVAGAQVFSYGLGLAATNCLNSFSYGYDRLRFIAPVFIGDTIYTIRENLSKEVKNKEMGKVRVSYSVFKGDGELALYCEHLMTALYRDPAAFADEIAASAEKKGDGVAADG
ncbi:MaoC family dehydratase [Hoeflea sp.]|uniref:MaoC family dehydratase n=1 Tax=Hoeflea sp. TaxID=1940281 RepID=UPI003B028F73